MPRLRESLFLKLLLVFIVAAGVILTILEVDEDLFLATPQREFMSSGLVLLVLLLTYVAIRWLLSPLRTLEAGVRELTKGNFDFSVEAAGKDELGRIVDSFNDMAHQIRTMLKARDQLLLDVSHELRSPLTRIKLALETSEDERSAIRSAVHEIEIMVSEILESARMDSARGKLVLDQIPLQAMLQELSMRYEKVPPGVILTGDDPNLTLKADDVRLRLAIQNLIDNAIKFSKHQSQPVQVTWNQISGSPSQVAIRVRDFGIGISQEAQPLIFEPFYRADPSRAKSVGGYGLGLSLTKKIVTAHGGTIHLESKPGDTIFTVVLPLQND